MEDALWLKTTICGRNPLVEDKVQWKTTFFDDSYPNFNEGIQVNEQNKNKKNYDLQNKDEQTASTHFTPHSNVLHF